jgi:hypothetical protein
VHITNPTDSDFSLTNLYWRQCNCDITLPVYPGPVYSGRATSVLIPITTPGTYAFAGQSADTSGNAIFGKTYVVALAASSLKLASTHAVSGLPSTISATVSPSNARGTFTLQSRAPHTTAWTTVTWATIAPYGKVTFTVKPATTTEYRVTFTNGAQWFGSQASFIDSVAQRVTISPTSKAALHGTRILLSGQVFPGAAGGGSVYLQQLVAGAWKTLTHLTLPKGGKFGFTVRPMTRGTYKYRFYRPAVTTNTAGYSAVATLAIS